MDVEAVPRLLPARMLNEFVYCPRLFYMEWVEDRFADNDDTVEGRYAHRRVDDEGGALPDPELVTLLREARSVRLSSEELGLVAVVDRVEQADGAVVPIDVKKGAPPRSGDAWPADVAQMAVQGMLLRACGYRCPSAIIYYAAVRRRVQIELTDGLLSDARRMIDEARETAASVQAPLPLVDSPKCPRCSLVALCLPDETNLMLARTQAPPRRILPRDPDHAPLYVTDHASYVGVRGGRVIVSKDREEVNSARLIDVSHLCVWGNVQVSTQALAAFFDRGIPVLWFTYGGWLRGWATGRPSGHVQLRRQQVVVSECGGEGIARDLIAGKIKNCRTLLRRNAKGDVTQAIAALGQLAAKAAIATGNEGLLGIEGTAARLYFDAFPRMLASQHAEMAGMFDLNGRSRRPPKDPVNALLSFCYALLLKDLVATLLGVRLDPYLGVLHRDRFGRPALALDLAEEFRPLIADSVVVNVLNNGEISQRDFVRRGDGWALTTEGRRSVIRAYERRMQAVVVHPIFKYKISYRRVLDVQARILAAVFLGEVKRYTPMTTR